MAWSARRTVGFAVGRAWVSPRQWATGGRRGCSIRSPSKYLPKIYPKYLLDTIAYRPIKYLAKSYPKYWLDTIAFKIFAKDLSKTVTDRQPLRLFKKFHVLGPKKNQETPKNTLNLYPMVLSTWKIRPVLYCNKSMLYLNLYNGAKSSGF